MLCEGHDPAVARKLRIEGNLEAGRQTFERVAREWRHNAKAQWATIHASDIIRSLERDVFPTIGTLPIAQLTPPLVLGVLREIEARGSIETAKRIRQRISALFVYAMAQGIAQSDPAEKLGAVLKPLRKGRQPAITELAPLRKMVLAADQDYARPITRLVLRLLALTAVRPALDQRELAVADRHDPAQLPFDLLSIACLGEIEIQILRQLTTDPHQLALLKPRDHVRSLGSLSRDLEAAAATRWAGLPSIGGHSRYLSIFNIESTIYHWI